jgi:hypothetical protein
LTLLGAFWTGSFDAPCVLVNAYDGQQRPTLETATGFRFHRFIKIAPDVRVNLSKSGASVSIGKPGATHSANWSPLLPQGRRRLSRRSAFESRLT